MLAEWSLKLSKVIIGNVYKFFRNLVYNEETRKNINLAQVQKLMVKVFFSWFRSTLTVVEPRSVKIVFIFPRKGYK